jgi:peroxiredoxin
MPADLQVGDIAPEFSLPSNLRGTVSLRDFRGHDVILYFYPEDDTPGCTREACDFRDQSETITREARWSSGSVRTMSRNTIALPRSIVSRFRF